jgi:hypothetical protein
MAGVEPRFQVQALRFLAHAATCITRWRSASELGGAPSISSGLAIPAASVGGGTSPAIDLCHDAIIAWHATSLNLAMRFAASFPYDWAVPRPLQRCQMMDFPLIEPDLFSSPLAGSLFGASPAVQANQWRPIASSPIQHIGLSATFPNTPLPAPGDAGFWGRQDHFTLTSPFAPAERCRQIVFWAVDWQAYEDCETAPSAPVDASKYPQAARLEGKSFSDRMWGVEFRDEQLYAYRNAEKVISFKESVAGQPTGFDVESLMLLNHPWGSQPDQGSSLDQRKCFNGMFGADRNFNRVLDRGPVPTSVRMRAVGIGRFNYYDPRVPAVLR